MLGHVAVKDSPPVVRNDEEAVENAEGQRRNSEEVHRGNRFTMVAQKGVPSFSQLWISGSLSHPAEHSSLRNVEAKHFQFTVNSRRAPSRVLGNHAENEITQFLADASFSHPDPMPREPRPIQLEPLPVPANDSLRLNEDQCLLPRRSKPSHQHLKQLIWSGKSRLRMPLFQHGELLAKSQVFQQQVAARTGRSNEQGEQEFEQAWHKASFTSGQVTVDRQFIPLIRQ